ncbi:MAG: YggS family pyridoxal phosphate-dependent enzyme [Gemmatimonadetes bacterium]|nr:YggS family pyridoxal phosphate-dependent enzyme [Gemmatimonadota bacterium]MBT8477985.1 YggS family pyridoxal phosphate-dependent enzyme [Gemmatimonadota bacterium]NNK49838.1 YggS family pyridoxal phosphate-dependent enzyme [Gemmatimonadota bacterium]
MNEELIRDRTLAIQETVDRAAARSGRSGSDVVVLPVTKGHPPGVLVAVAAAGFGAIGENRVTEAEAKLAEIGRRGLRWRMVGHLQRNKARRAIDVFDAIESVDSLRLARRLHSEAEKADRASVSILAQVNAGGEAQKNGLDPAETVDAVGAMLDLGRVRVEGLMTMAPFTSDETVLRRTFRVARECLARCQAELTGFDGHTLSMGMSNDFEFAVEEGSTEVRLGTVLLGERPEV